MHGTKHYNTAYYLCSLSYQLPASLTTTSKWMYLLLENTSLSLTFCLLHYQYEPQQHVPETRILVFVYSNIIIGLVYFGFILMMMMMVMMTTTMMMVKPRSHRTRGVVWLRNTLTLFDAKRPHLAIICILLDARLRARCERGLSCRQLGRMHTLCLAVQCFNVLWMRRYENSWHFA